VEVTTYCFPELPHKKIPLVKIGVGEHPCRSKAQLKEKVDPPRFRMQTDQKGQLSKDSLMLLFNKPPPQTHTTTTESPVPGSAPATPLTTPAVAAAASPLLRQPSYYSPVKLAQRFNISTPDKPKLVMELMPLMREIVKGSSTMLETHNNQQKCFVHIPKCSTEASAMSQMIKYKFVQEIIYILGGGAVNVVGGLHKGALWLCREMQDLFGLEFTHSVACAGATCISRMSLKATAAMWTDVKLTKTKSRKILSHLLDWFKQPITAKEPDLDALAGQNIVKRKYDSYQITAQKGKKQSEDDIKKRLQFISIKYWISYPFEAVEDELISRLNTDNNHQLAIQGFKFPLLDIPAIATCFLADHGNIAWRAGLTIIASEKANLFCGSPTTRQRLVRHTNKDGTAYPQ
jgi:hypothetical protein